MHARSFLVEALCPNSCSKDTPFILPHPGTHRETGIGPEWMDVGETLGIKDTLLSFMTILRAGHFSDPRALERLQFLSSRTIDSLLTAYSQNYSTHPSPTCKDKQCNPLRLVTERPWSMT
jgi:hypothetical protein